MDVENFRSTGEVDRVNLRDWGNPSERGEGERPGANNFCFKIIFIDSLNTKPSTLRILLTTTSCQK